VNEPETIELIAGEADAGLRLDRFLAAALPDVSRSLIQKHIEAGAVSIDGAAPLRGAKTAIRTGSSIRYTPPPPEPIDLVAEEIPIALIYEDADIVVVDKPAELVVHPGAGHPRGTLINALLARVPDFAVSQGDLRPGIVHRLDRGTTGVMVVAKNLGAQHALIEAFQSRQVKKHYLAVVHGSPAEDEATIESFFGRHPKDRKRFTARLPEGKEAITHFEVLERFPGASLLEVRIDTGRTHQIRVHLAERGHPLVGDDTYGRRRRTTADPRVRPLLTTFARPALHARRLSFAHPRTGRKMRFEAPVPADLASLIEALRAAKEEPVISG